MLLTALGNLWRRLWSRLHQGQQRHPAWGPKPPVILGICRDCGAVVLEGWQAATAEGYRCRRCDIRAGSAGDRP